MRAQPKRMADLSSARGAESVRAVFNPQRCPPLLHQTNCSRVELRASAFKNFGNGLLDYLEAGPKLRKWYGEGERRPQDGGGPGPEEDDDEEATADSVLVTDADTPTGELVLLQLILARLKVTALVPDRAAALNAYGDYVRPVQGRVGQLLDKLLPLHQISDENGDEGSLRNALKTAKALVCPASVGSLPQGLASSRVRHVVLLSTVGASEPSFLGKLLGGQDAALADPAREEALKACGVPLTVVRVGRLVDSPGGAAELSFSQGSAVRGGEVCREDVAQVLVRALQKPPRTNMTFAVSGSPTGQKTNWERLFANLQEA